MNTHSVPPSSIDGAAHPRCAAGVRLQTDRLTGQTVLLFPEGMLKLNSTGAAIIELCDGHRTCADVSAALAERFNAPADTLRTDVIEYLARLVNRGLLRIDDAPAAKENGGEVPRDGFSV